MHQTGAKNMQILCTNRWGQMYFYSTWTQYDTLTGGDKEWVEDCVLSELLHLFEFFYFATIWTVLKSSFISHPLPSPVQRMVCLIPKTNLIVAVIKIPLSIQIA